MSNAMLLDLPPMFLDAAARSLVLLGLAGLVTLALWRASAAARHLVWTLALVGVLAIPALRPALPAVELPVPLTVLGPTTTARAAASLTTPLPEPGGETAPPASSASSPEASRLDAPHPASGPGGSRSAASAASTEASAAAVVAGPGQVDPGVATTGARAARSPAESPGGWFGGRSTRALPLVVWLLGVGLLGLPLGVGWIGLHRLARRSRRLPHAEIRHRATRLALRLGLRRSYRLLEGPAGSMPLTFGLFRAAIVLPADAAEWSRARLDAVLLHELAHVARRDTATQLVADVVRALHWFNPLAWLAAHRLRVEREHACDDMALAAGPRPSEYADELLELVRAYRGAGAPAVALAMARRGQVAGRLRAILDERRRRERVRRAPALAGSAVALLVVLACTAAAPVPSTPALDGGPPERAAAPIAAADDTAPAQVQATTCIAEPGDWSRVQINTRNGRETIRLERRGCEFELRMEGEVDIDPLAMTIRGMGSGARLRIEEDSRGADHDLDIRVGRDGAPVYTYERDGRDQAFDRAAEAWLAAALHSVFRQTGFMSRARVGALLEAGGVETVLRELGELTRPHVFASYTEALLEQAELDEAQLRALVRSSARRVESDHYMAGILEAVATYQPLVGGLLDDYLQATIRLDSDHYRSESLQAAIQSDRLTPAQIEQVLRAAGTMDSDHYRSGILTGIADRYALQPSFRATYIEATAAMDSDHYRAQVLGRLLDRGDLSADDKAGVLRAAGMLDSDHYRSQLLRKVADHGLDDPTLRRAFFDVAAGMDSDHYYRQSLSALLDQRIEPALLVSVLESAAREIDSDHYLSELLLEVLADYPVEGAVRDAFLAAMDAVESGHYRGRVADALLRAERG